MEILRHEFSETVLLYLIDKTKKVSMLLLPKDKEKDLKKSWEVPNDSFDARCKYMHQWQTGNIVHLQLSHHPRQNGTMKFN